MIRQDVSPAFQKVCHSPRGLNTHDPWGSENDFVAEQRSERSFEDVRVLVLVVVKVERSRERSTGNRMLDNREATGGLGALDLPDDSEAAEVDRRPFGGLNGHPVDRLQGCSRHPGSPLLGCWCVCCRR